MSDASTLPFFQHILAWRKHNPKERLSAHLLELWRTNALFQRMVEMDKIKLVNTGESFYCTRFIGDHHHRVCYPTWSRLYAGLNKAGYHLRCEDWEGLRRKGVLYATNGMDNRINWVMPVDRKTCNLLNTAGYRVRDVYNDRVRLVKVGDFLCVDDVRADEEGLYGLGRKLVIKVSQVRSKAYGLERFKSLHHALVKVG